jgi:hypothetical protein
VEFAACMRSEETAAGPDGVPMTFVAAHETSSDQAASTIIFAEHDAHLIPSAVVRGECDARFSPPPEERRYDLPQSEGGVEWAFIGLIDGRNSLMMRTDSGSDRADLVSVGLAIDGPPRVVGHVPAGAEVLAPGMTYGLLDF